MCCCSAAVNLFSAVWSQPGWPASSGDRQDIQDRPGEIQRTGSRVDAEVRYVMIRPIYSTPTFILVINICFKTFKRLNLNFSSIVLIVVGEWREWLFCLGEIHPFIAFFTFFTSLKKNWVKVKRFIMSFCSNAGIDRRLIWKLNPFPIPNVSKSSIGEQIE